MGVWGVWGGVGLGGYLLLFTRQVMGTGGGTASYQHALIRHAGKRSEVESLTGAARLSFLCSLLRVLPKVVH